MILHPPLKISARLLPAIKIGETWISYDNCGDFVFDFPDGSEYTADSYHPGCGHEIEDVFADILSFLDAALESRDFRLRTGIEGECEDLFPPHVLDWMAPHQCEIQCYASNLENDDG